MNVYEHGKDLQCLRCFGRIELKISPLPRTKNKLAPSECWLWSDTGAAIGSLTVNFEKTNHIARAHSRESIACKMLGVLTVVLAELGGKNCFAIFLLAVNDA